MRKVEGKKIAMTVYKSKLLKFNWMRICYMVGFFT